MIDAASDLICGLDVLPANADEAANAKSLLEQEEQAHSNNIESLSLAASGCHGAVLKALSEDEAGPQLTVFVPPKEHSPRHPELLPADAFKLNEAGDEGTCPNGASTRTRHRDGKSRPPQSQQE